MNLELSKYSISYSLIKFYLNICKHFLKCLCRISKLCNDIRLPLAQFELRDCELRAEKKNHVNVLKKVHLCLNWYICIILAIEFSLHNVPLKLIKSWYHWFRRKLTFYKNVVKDVINYWNTLSHSFSLSLSLSLSLYIYIYIYIYIFIYIYIYMTGSFRYIKFTITEVRTWVIIPLVFLLLKTIWFYCQILLFAISSSCS